MFDFTFEIPCDCALNCVHCSHNYEQEAQIDHPCFDSQDITSILEAIPKPTRVRVSGGEPFMDLPTTLLILKEAKARGIATEILTSGVYSHRRIGDSAPQPIPEESICAVKGIVDNLGFSLYGSERVHDKVTRVPGSFKCLDRTLAVVRANMINFSFHFIAMRKAIPGIEDALQYVKYQSTMVGREIPLRILRFIKQGEGLASKQALTVREIQEFRSRLNYLEEKYGVRILLGCSFKERGCVAGIGKGVETSRGYFPCSALKEYGGELKKDGECACRDRW